MENLDIASVARYSGGTVTTPSLTISNAQLEDEGNYRCLASNTVGSGQSGLAFLDVVGSMFNPQKQNTHQNPLVTISREVFSKNCYHLYQMVLGNFKFSSDDKLTSIVQKVDHWSSLNNKILQNHLNIWEVNVLWILTIFLLIHSMQVHVYYAISCYIIFHHTSKKRENIIMNLCVPVIGNHEIHEH